MRVKHNKTLPERRKIRVRRKLNGTADRPRLTVFRSNQHIYLQLINDETGKTVASVNDLQADIQKAAKDKKKMETAKIVAEVMADKMKKAKIDKAIFDRGSYRYHGKVKLVADTLREKGIQI